MTKELKYGRISTLYAVQSPSKTIQSRLGNIHRQHRRCIENRPAMPQKKQSKISLA